MAGPHRKGRVFKEGAAAGDSTPKTHLNHELHKGCAQKRLLPLPSAIAGQTIQFIVAAERRRSVRDQSGGRVGLTRWSPSNSENSTTLNLLGPKDSAVRRCKIAAISLETKIHANAENVIVPLNDVIFDLVLQITFAAVSREKMDEAKRLQM